MCIRSIPRQCWHPNGTRTRDFRVHSPSIVTTMLPATHHHHHHHHHHRHRYDRHRHPHSVVHFDFQIPRTEMGYGSELVSNNQCQSCSNEYKNKWLVIENSSASECDWYTIEYTDWEIVIVNNVLSDRYILIIIYYSCIIIKMTANWIGNLSA